MSKTVEERQGDLLRILLCLSEEQRADCVQFAESLIAKRERRDLLRAGVRSGGGDGRLTQKPDLRVLRATATTRDPNRS